MGEETSPNCPVTVCRLRKGRKSPIPMEEPYKREREDGERTRDVGGSLCREFGGDLKRAELRRLC